MKININILIFFCLSLSLMMLSSFSKESLDKNEFKYPDNRFYPMPFWHLNGQLTSEKIYEQLESAYDESGFGGVAVLPVSRHPNTQNSEIMVSGTIPQFLSDEYFDFYKEILSISQSKGKEVIMYDDEDFPSGIAGGKMRQHYPDLLSKRLDKQEVIVSAGEEASLTVPEGIVMSAVAMDTLTKELRNITSNVVDGTLDWIPQEGVFRVMLFTCVDDGTGIVDYMDPVAVEKYIDLTYEEYNRHLSDYFGNVIKRAYIDDVGYVFRTWGWTPLLNEKFEEINGYNPEIYYPALWYDIGPNTASVRVAFHNTRAELLAEGFPRMVSEWCDLHKLELTGHPPANYEACPDAHFDIFKFYRHMHQPLMDMIHYYGYGRPGYNLISSVADYYGRNIITAEAYGNFRGNFDKTMMYRAIMELFTRGVNRIIPHGMWYSHHPDSVAIPPLISSYNPVIASDLKPYNEFVARSCYMLQQGNRVTDIAVVYPIKALQGWYQFFKHESLLGENIPQDIDYYRLSDILTRVVRRDFIFVHPDFLASDDYTISSNGKLKRVVNDNKELEFKLVILPGGEVQSVETLKKLKVFYDNGGKILATSKLPSKSSEPGRDAEVMKLIEEIFGQRTSVDGILDINVNESDGRALFIADIEDEVIFTKTLDDLGITADVSFPFVPQKILSDGELSYIHRKLEGTDIYYIANSTDNVIDTYLDLLGKKNPTIWNPYSGDTEKISDVRYFDENGEIFTRVPIKLGGVESTFLVSN